MLCLASFWRRGVQECRAARIPVLREKESGALLSGYAMRPNKIDRAEPWPKAGVNSRERGSERSATVVPKWKSLSLVIVVRCPRPPRPRARPRCQPLPHPGGACPASVDLPVVVSVGRGLPATEWNSDTTPSITWTEWTPGARKWKTLAARARQWPRRRRFYQMDSAEDERDKEKGNMREREREEQILTNYDCVIRRTQDFYLKNQQEIPEGCGLALLLSCVKW